LKDAAWTNGRILLSNKRIVLAGNDGKRNLPLSGVASLSGRYDVNQTVAQVSDYVSIQMNDESVLLLSMGRTPRISRENCTARSSTRRRCSSSTLR